MPFFSASVGSTKNCIVTSTIKPTPPPHFAFFITHIINYLRTCVRK
jgi:hypothetical protein